MTSPLILCCSTHTHTHTAQTGSHQRRRVPYRCRCACRAAGSRYRPGAVGWSQAPWRGGGTGTGRCARAPRGSTGSTRPRPAPRSVAARRSAAPPPGTAHAPPPPPARTRSFGLLIGPCVVRHHRDHPSSSTPRRHHRLHHLLHHILLLLRLFSTPCTSATCDTLNCSVSDGGGGVQTKTIPVSPVSQCACAGGGDVAGTKGAGEAALLCVTEPSRSAARAPSPPSPTTGRAPPDSAERTRFGSQQQQS